MEIVLKIVIALFVFSMALAISSFLNVVIYRLPLGMNLSFPPSHCPTCNHKLQVKDNIPVLSYLFLKGKCRYCHTHIPIRYTIVELVGSVSVLLNYLYYGFTPTFFLISGIIFVFICIFFIDIEHYIIPDSLIVVLFILGVLSLFFNDLSYKTEFVGLESKLYSLIVNGVILLTFHVVYKLTGIEAIGFGDIKLFFVMGLFMGFELELLGIFFASVIALLFEAFFGKKVKHKTLKDIDVESPHQDKKAIPFGPYLTLGFLISFYVGLPLLYYYQSLFFSITMIR